MANRVLRDPEPVVDEATIEERVTTHMDLALRIAKYLTVKHRLNLDDAFDDACWGLFRAARLCEYDRPFGPYAQKFIRGSIYQGVRDRFGTRKKIEMPKFTEFSPELSEQISDDSPSPYQKLLYKELWRAVDRLPERQRISLLLNLEDVTQAQIGKLFGVSQMQVCRYLKQAREALAEALAA